MNRIIMHIDVNNAFLSWTAVYLLNHNYKIDIRKTYAIIGTEKERKGIVLAKSTPIKKLGVVSGETIYEAKKKCPTLKIYPPNYRWYKYMSEKMFELIQKYSPDIEKMSIDECFLDYTKVNKLYGDPIKFAYKLQKEIYDKLGFTVNIGIANNKFCAKMASNFTKPNRVHTLFENEIQTKMWPLPIEKLFLIGKKTSLKLRKININTVKDLANSDEIELSKYFKNTAYKMIKHANGIDEDEVISEITKSKGISNSTTPPKNLIYKEEVYKIIHQLSNNLTTQLRKEKRYAYTVCIQIKTSEFKNYTHQKKLQTATNSTAEVYEIAKHLFDEMNIESKIRLVGIRLDNLTNKQTYQISLFENNDIIEESQIENTIDDINQKYGKSVITKASLKNNKTKKKY